MKKLAAVFLLLGLSSFCYAKSLKLYDEAKADAKVVGTVDSNAGIITIFSPSKESEWVKVADPRNGNVGWVKSSELKGMGVHFNMMQVGDGNHSYQVVQYGDTTATPEQIADMAKKMQLRQQALQNDMNRLMSEMYDEMHQYWMSSPMVMPILVVPEKKPADVKPQPSPKGNEKNKNPK